MIPYQRKALLNTDLNSIKKDDFESIKIEGTKAHQSTLT